MHVITRKRLVEFGEIHPDAIEPLDIWYRVMRRGRFRSPHVIQETFCSVSFLGNGLTAFNIGGNKYRLAVKIIYATDRTEGRVYVRKVMTHEEYDDWK